MTTESNEQVFWDKIAAKTFTPEEHDQLVRSYERRREAMEAEHAAWARQIDDIFESAKRDARKYTDLSRWTTWFSWGMFWISGFLFRGLFQ